MGSMNGGSSPMGGAPAPMPPVRQAMPGLNGQVGAPGWIGGNSAPVAGGPVGPMGSKTGAPAPQYGGGMAVAPQLAQFQQNAMANQNQAMNNQFQRGQGWQQSAFLGGQPINPGAQSQGKQGQPSPQFGGGYPIQGNAAQQGKMGGYAPQYGAQSKLGGYAPQFGGQGKMGGQYPQMGGKMGGQSPQYGSKFGAQAPQGGPISPYQQQAAQALMRPPAQRMVQ